MRKPLLFLPGPMQVPDQVQIAGNRPLFNHRSPQMLELLGRLETRCQPLIRHIRKRPFSGIFGYGRYGVRRG